MPENLAIESSIPIIPALQEKGLLGELILCL